MSGGVGTPEGFVIDPDGSSPLNLGNTGTLRLAGLSIPPAPKRPEWASNADTDGQALVRNPLHDNRQCSMQVRVRASSMDSAMTALGTLQGKLQEACIQGAGNGAGLKCNWTPAGASHTLALYMVYGEITDLPVTYDDGWFSANPVVTVTFQCKPFLYGSEVTGPTASGTTPLLTVEVDSVPGDVPAEARLVVTDGTAQPRRWVEWGLEQRYYDSASPAALFIDSASLVTSGFAGAGTAETGAYGGSVVGTTLFSQALALCGTGDLGHVGTFRVKARVITVSQDQYWRLSWQAGDGPYIGNDWVQPVTTNTDYSELDFGLVTIEPVEAGTQKWSARVEAYTTDGSGTKFGGIDYLALIPALEYYGRVEAAYTYQPGVITARDDFSGGTIGGTLNGHVAIAGGTWATSGATTDFQYESGSVVARETLSDSGPRFAILGTTTHTDVEVGVTTLFDPIGADGTVDARVIARWTDSSNYLRLDLQYNTSITEFELTLVQRVAGVDTQLDQYFYEDPELTTHSLRLVAYASGRAIGWLLDSSGNVLAQVDSLQSVLATGGTLASGKCGFGDQNASGVDVVRAYGTFYVATPFTETLAMNSGKSLEVRSDSNLRQSTSGTTYGDIPSRGSRLLIPQAGDVGRKSRIAVRAIREDPVTMVSRNDGDSTQLSVFYTPRFLGVPRS